MPAPHDHGEIESDDQVQVQHERAPRQASRYRVVFFNDDYTTMEFVVETLMQFFAKSEVEATRIMLEVHHKGRGVAGTYVRDVAESKVDQVEAHARAHGHPLKCTAEPADISLDSQS
jgi:ATP-dependent Clp protease adaptor protein ClpS